MVISGILPSSNRMLIELLFLSGPQRFCQHSNYLVILSDIKWHSASKQRNVSRKSFSVSTANISQSSGINESSMSSVGVEGHSLLVSKLLHDGLIPVHVAPEGLLQN